MYVVCLLFYAIGRFLYLFLFVLLIAEFYQQFVSEVFIAETMHVCYSVTDQGEDGSVANPDEEFLYRRCGKES